MEIDLTPPFPGSSLISGYVLPPMHPVRISRQRLRYIIIFFLHICTPFPFYNTKSRIYIRILPQMHMRLPWRDIKRAEPSGSALIRRLASLSSVSDHRIAPAVRHEHQCAPLLLQCSRFPYCSDPHSCFLPAPQAVDCRIGLFNALSTSSTASPKLVRQPLGIVHQNCFYQLLLSAVYGLRIQLVPWHSTVSSVLACLRMFWHSDVPLSSASVASSISAWVVAFVSIPSLRSACL